MKKLKMIALLFPFALCGQVFQKDSTFTSATLDTVIVYNCQVSVLRSDGSITYKVNKKIVSKEEYDRIADGFRQRNNCNPCYVKFFDLQGDLESCGVYYHNCPEDKKVSVPGHDSFSELAKQQKFCKHGEWKYFNKKGKLKQVENFVYGKSVNSRR
jgi:hypothetical protein